MRTPAVVVALAAALSGCGETNSNQGEVGDHCDPSSGCNTGLSCSEGICHAVDASIDAIVVDALVCADPYEPDPYVTGVDTVQSSITLPGAMICPAGDKDTFHVRISSTGKNVEMIITTDATNPIVEGAFVNNAGTPMVNASPVAGMPQVRRAYLQNLPSGDFYVRAYAAPTAISHYQVQVNVTAP